MDYGNFVCFELLHGCKSQWSGCSYDPTVLNIPQTGTGFRQMSLETVPQSIKGYVLHSNFSFQKGCLKYPVPLLITSIRTSQGPVSHDNESLSPPQFTVLCRLMNYIDH